MSNRDGKHTKLRHKIFSDFSKWFRGDRPFRKWFPKGNSVHPYDWDFHDGERIYQKYKDEKIKDCYKNQE